jgi:hypothetical protein
MTYYAGRDRRGRTWVRASVHEAATGNWHTEIGRCGAGRWWDVRKVGVQHLYAPVWVRDRVYGVSARNGHRFVACFGVGTDELPALPLVQRWENLERFPMLEDLTVFETAGELHAWASVGSSAYELRLHHWRSSDGIEWTHEGIALSAESPGPRFDIVNNPSVVRADGGWRLFFRTGSRPALGNTIRSAFSDDLRTWRHETGERVSPGGRWDPHGVGFPYVWKESGGGWTMLYAGYWGGSREAVHTARHWHELERPS